MVVMVKEERGVRSRTLLHPLARRVLELILREVYVQLFEAALNVLALEDREAVRGLGHAGSQRHKRLRRKRKWSRDQSSTCRGGREPSALLLATPSYQLPSPLLLSPLL
jgi:hypothetical protein